MLVKGDGGRKGGAGANSDTVAVSVVVSRFFTLNMGDSDSTKIT
jgi:hypothetical protein